MPCYTQRTVSVELKTADAGVLLRALAAAGFENVRADAYGAIHFRTQSGARAVIVDGAVEMTGEYVQQRAAENVARDVKRAYAAEAVRTAAKKSGWGLATSKKTGGKMTLTRKAW
jgi:hypothetical protein